MPAHLRIFDNHKKSCNPYIEFWEFLEWLARRRQYPEPMYIWHAVKFSKPVSHPRYNPMKFPASKKEAFRFPAADEKREKLNIYRR